MYLDIILIKRKTRWREIKPHKNSNQILFNFHKYRLFDVILFAYENNTRLEKMHKKAVFIGVQ